MRFIQLAVFTSMVWCAFARGEESSWVDLLGLSGRLIANHATGVREPNQHQPLQSYAAFWLKSQKSGEVFSERIVLTYESVPKINNGNLNYKWFDRVGVREAVVGYQPLAGLRISAGKDILKWGSSDGVNPTQYLVARDFTLFNQSDEVRDLGSENLRVSWTPNAGDSPWEVEAVLQARGPRSKLLIPSQVVGFQSLSVFSERDQNQAFFGNQTELATRLNYYGMGFDLRLSGFRGRNRLPVFFVDSLQSVTARYPRLWGAGLDGSYSRGEWVLRTEHAFLKPESFAGKEELIQPAHWDGVYGVERKLFEDYRIQLQGLSRFHVRATRPETYQNSNLFLQTLEQQVGRANQLLLNYREQWLFGGTLRIEHKKEDSDWEQSFTLLGYHKGVGYLARPQVRYQLVQDWRIGLSLDAYGGPETGSLGALRAFSQALAQLEGYF